MLYLCLKAIHVAASILFAAGVLASAVLIQWLQTQASSSDTKNIAAAWHSWNARVTTPAMLVVWALGFTLAMQGGWGSSDWLKLKFVCVLTLSALHGMQSGALRRIAVGPSTRNLPDWVNARALTVILIAAIAILAVAKPL
jgi:uncharacterized membrane protein